MSDANIDDYFFFSYAREDQERKDHIQEFFNDLCEEIRGQTGLRSQNRIGFFDQQSIAVGQEWPGPLANALRCDRTLVCLYSPRFFASVHCGREVQVFLDRHKGWRSDASLEAILPVIWRTEGVVPEALSKVTYNDSDLPKVYLEQGLRLLKLNKSTAYRKTVAALARKIVTSYTHALPVSLTAPRYANVKSAFDAPLPAPVEHQSEGFIRNTGPDSVCFVYMAATRPEIESSGIRKTTEFYGNLRRDWAPYSNGSKREEIWNIAFSCARACNQYPSSHEPDSALADFLKRAKATNTPIVLLVDTWSLKIAELMRQVEHYDNFGFSNSAALVVWDEGPDTEAEKDELQELVAKAFDDNLSRSNPRFFRHSVSTRAALSKELRSTLQHLRMNIINRGFPLRLVSGPRPLPIP